MLALDDYSRLRCALYRILSGTHETGQLLTLPDTCAIAKMALLFTGEGNERAYCEAQGIKIPPRKGIPANLPIILLIVGFFLCALTGHAQTKPANMTPLPGYEDYPPGVIIPEPTTHAKHFYKDWRWLAGAAVIAGATAVDVQSSCRAFAHGAHETNPLIRGTQSCGKVAALGITFGTFQVGLHALVWHCSQNIGWHCIGMNHDDDPHRKLWNTVQLMTVPAIDAPPHIWAAVHNYRLPYYSVRP